MAQVVHAATPPLTCPACGTAVAAALLSCPQCQWLVHSERLAGLARDADAAAARNDLAAAIATWREALTLLPSASRQHETISARIVDLGRRQAASEDRPRTTSAQGAPWTLVGSVGAAAAFVLTKGKFLLLGATKSATLFSMLASFALYWTQWGWLFALGLVISIYIHEMGHVAALRRYGIPASAPMFIPGIGAFVRMHQLPTSRVEDARVGLEGPIWGLGAATVAAAAFAITRHPLWAALAHAGAWINLFNLLPVWQLDGSRALSVLSRSQRWIVAAAVLVAWRVSGDGVLVLILIALVARALWDSTAPEEGHTGTLGIFVALVAAFTVLMVRFATSAGS